VTGDLTSIVVAVYNGAAFLGEALDSALAQDYDPIEVVVVDDGSTDETPEVIARYPEVVALRQGNAGPGAARNAGIAAARGAFIAFVDADDTVPAGKLSAQVGYLRDHPDVSVVLGRQEARIENGLEEPHWHERPAWLPRTIAWDGREQIPPMTMVARREAFDRVGPFDTRFRFGDDLDWLLRAHEAGMGLAMVDEVVLIRRAHGDNVTADQGALTREILMCLRARIERARAGR
jgi:glycosyltransferase involved in cell wall biosynthesis